MIEQKRRIESKIISGEAGVRRGFRCSRRGFTIVEASVALMVFSFIIIIFASVVLMAKSSSRMNGQYAQAISLAQHKIDQLRAFGYGRLTYADLEPLIIDATPTSSPFSFAVVDGMTGADAASEDIGLISPTATVALSDVDTNTKKAVVTIKWKSNAKSVHLSSVSLTAYIVNVE